MEVYYIRYIEGGNTGNIFRCQADSEDHAKEQFYNAYPDLEIHSIDYVNAKIKYLAGTQWINTYLIDRAYGGPEEGGWYYNCGEAVRSIQVTEETLPETLQEACGWAEQENRSRRSDINSVLSEGRYDVRVEDQPGVDYPAEIPHYE